MKEKLQVWFESWNKKQEAWFKSWKKDDVIIYGDNDVVPYRMIKKLPETGTFCPVDRDEMTVFQKALFRMGYKWTLGSNLVRNIDGKILFWYSDMKITYSDDISRWRIDVESAQKFKDYFEPVEGFAGYHEGKNYGI